MSGHLKENAHAGDRRKSMAEQLEALGAEPRQGRIPGKLRIDFGRISGVIGRDGRTIESGMVRVDLRRKRESKQR